MHGSRAATPAILLLAMVGAFVVAGSASAADSREPPNIVLIVADDLGYGHLGSYGQQKIETPHIDRLAAEGMLFTQAYAGSHVCQPSRSVLMTGLHTGHTPVRANDENQLLLESDVTVAEVLKAAGYATGAFGKWGLGYIHTPGHPNRQGFDDFFGQLLQVHAHFYYPYFVWHNERPYMLPGNERGQRKQYAADEIHVKAKDFIRRNRGRPFFAYLPVQIPHVELVVPPESEAPYRGRFPGRAVPDPREGYIGSEDGYATLAGMISRLDMQVGEILSLLKELGIDERTLVIFTSDNGAQGGGKNGAWAAMTDFFRGNGALRGYKGTFYEGGIRVPLIARWPGHIPAGRTSDLICGLWDLLPTLADVSGAPPPAGLDGISLLPTLTGSGRQRTHDAIYWEYPRSRGLERAARMGRWKAIQKRPNRSVELYDLVDDVGETRNVAPRHPDIVEQMIARMDAAHSEPRAYPESIKRPKLRDYVR